MKHHEMRVLIAGQELIFQTGKIARQANGSVVLRNGDTMVLATACASQKPLPDIDFLPLRIDYQEKFSSIGKTVSGFIKREGKPTEREILTCRLIDRPLRPMFEDGYFNDTQILSYVWSYDGVNSPDVLAICAASCALSLSDIPLIKPIAAVRVGYINGQCVVNPTVEQQKTSTLDLVIAGTEDAVLMIEGSCQFLTEEQVLKAIELGQESIRTICHAIAKWQSEIGKPKKRDTLKVLSPELAKVTEQLIAAPLNEAVKIKEKQRREEAFAVLEKQVIEHLRTENMPYTCSELDAKSTFKKVQSNAMRQMILQEGVRCDGRSTSEIRPIFIEQSFLPRAHGSSLFTRGETQAMAICVLGGENMAQRFENLEGEGAQRFYLQYFFPPFSVGEVGRSGPPGRREVGHGKLAERALHIVLPTKENFPYTIRLESNITESNGSSSMASVCGGCLALMDAGVPIERPVAGIAMGLILEKNNYAILSDILGVEDALGDMDFKITGDHEGITAFQMDIKVEGITTEIMRAALAQAKKGRVHILEKMLAVCPKSREKMSQWAPRIETIQIKPSKIGTIIGPGGKQIRAIIEEFSVDVDISDDGLVSISSSSFQGLEDAKAYILSLVAEVEPGRSYEGKITSIVPFGVFVELLPGKEGLCHISELDNFRIENIFDYTEKQKMKIGDNMSVVVLEINDRGQVKLSRRAAMTKHHHTRAAPQA